MAETDREGGKNETDTEEREAEKGNRHRRTIIAALPATGVHFENLRTIQTKRGNQRSHETKIAWRQTNRVRVETKCNTESVIGVGEGCVVLGTVRIEGRNYCSGNCCAWRGTKSRGKEFLCFGHADSEAIRGRPNASCAAKHHGRNTTVTISSMVIHP